MIGVRDVLSSSSCGGTDFARTRELAGRKTMRLLERISYAPFVAAHDLLTRNPGLAVEDLALFTVSSWEPEVPCSVEPHDSSWTSREQQAVRFQKINPVQWLSGMPNSALCQIAISTGIRGPNLHFVGDASTLVLALEFAGEIVTGGAAPAAVVVAFEPLDQQTRFVEPDGADSAAAAVLLGTAPEARAAISFEHPSLIAGQSSVAVINTLSAALDTGGSDTAPNDLPGMRLESCG